jgi:ribonuclease PH
MTGDGRLVEVQGSAEGATFSRGSLDSVLDLVTQGIDQLLAQQQEVLRAAAEGRV